MRNKMNKKELRKIEEKLSDAEIPDSVLDKARSEMQSVSAKPKKSVRFNYKLALSCAASLVLSLAIILPVSLSAFKKSGSDKFESGNIRPDVPQSPDEDLSPPSDAASPSEISLENLDKTVVYDEIEDNETGADEPPLPQDKAIYCTAHYKYSYGSLEIISEEKYSVKNNDCVLYTLYDIKYSVDVLADFSNLNSEYKVEDLVFRYKAAYDGYLAEANLRQKRYCFILDTANISVFEDFCKYLYGKILK